MNASDSFTFFADTEQDSSVLTSSAGVQHFVNSDFLKNPYPSYRALRQQGPIHWSAEFCGGAWLLLDYADVASVLKDARFSVQRSGSWVNSSGPGARDELMPLKSIMSRALLFLDGAMHARLRRVMNAGFRPALIQEKSSRIQAIADELLNQVEGQDEFDFIEHFARPLPSLVIADLLGVEVADYAEFAGWSERIAAFIGSPSPNLELARDAQNSLLALTDYFRALLLARRGMHGEDLVSLLLRAEQGGMIKTSKELLAQCAMLLFAGQETTRHLLGTGLLALLEHPAQWEQLKTSPAYFSSAIRELLRYDSPVQYTGRRLLEDLTMHGQLLRRGELVIPLIGAANRDPTRFADPDRLDIARNHGSHLAFGTGAHVCIGASLTLLEVEIAFKCIMRRLPTVRLRDTGIAVESRDWVGNAAYRGLANLFVVREGTPLS